MGIAALRDLDPSYFALVMGTGIVSRAMRLDGAVALSDVLLAVGLTVFVLMSGAYALRLAVSWLVTLGRYEAWVALAAWAAVVAAMAAAALRHGRR